jgi:hypothetical protein
MREFAKVRITLRGGSREIEETEGGGEAMTRPLDSWFLILFGAGLVVYARPLARSLAYRLEGEHGPEERQRDARRGIVINRIIGGGLLAWAGWRVLGL